MQRVGKAPSEMPSFQPYWGKPAVRNDRGDRGDVGIIRSPVRASILPDCGGRSVTGVPTAINTTPPPASLPYEVVVTNFEFEPSNKPVPDCPN